MSDCEIAQYYTWKERVANKEHDCCECSAKIVPGEKYLQVNACWDNLPCVERQHLLCAAACEFVRDKGLNDDECIYFGGLQEWYRDWVKGGFGNIDETVENRTSLWRMILAIMRRERKKK